MYTNIVTIFIVLLSYGCLNGNRQSRDVLSDTEKLLVNDTLFTSDLNYADTQKIKVLKSCYIMLCDSVSDVFLWETAKVQTDKYLNFRATDGEYYFKMYNDTLKVTFLHEVNKHRYFYRIPDSIYFKHDTLVIIESAKRFREQKNVSEIAFDLSEYLIQIKGVAKDAISIKYNIR